MLQKIQRFGGAMFAPAMLFSISGLMVGISALATTVDIVGDLAVYGTPWYVFWTIIQRGSWTVFKRLPLLFAVALPIGLAQKQPARCCLEALVAYFAYCFFLSEIIKLSGDNLGLKYPSSLTPASGITVIDGIKTLDTGIIGPLAVSATVVAIHDRFYAAKVPDWLGTFSGSSLVYLISFFAVFALAAISAAIVPFAYAVTETLRHALAGVGPFGVGIFVFLERALEPMGLHHLLYMPIYYDNLVIHDGIYATWTNLLPILSHSTRPLNELAPWAGFTATGWGKLFGLPAIAAAFYFTAKPERRAGLKVILLPAIVASVVCGVTEPLEFLFMFTYPGLFLLYAVLSSCLAMTMNFFGIVGIFIGTVVSTLSTCTWVEPYILFRHGFGAPVGKYFARYALNVLLTAAAGAATWYICALLPAAGFGAFGVKVLLCCVLPNLFFLLVYGKTSEFRYFLTLGKSVLGKRMHKSA